MSSLVISILGALLATGMTVCLVLADATPVQLVLLYMPNVSNTGTTTASGIAELVMPEGEVRITAVDLPPLAGARQYVAWVINTDSNEFQRLAAFNSAESSSAVHYESVLTDAIPNRHWNLLLVTVEDTALPTRPSNQHSIAGVFPSPDNSPLPVALPNTGGIDPYELSVTNRSDWRLIAGLAALAGTLGVASGYVLGLKKR